MRIRRLQVRNLRRYHDLDVELAPGVTVVRGPNEAGKTTIQRAIELAITRRVTSTAGDLDALRPWDVPGETRPWIAMEFEQEEEDGRLATGVLEKSFAGQKGTVRLEYDGQTVTDPTLADQVLAELTGIPTEAFFRSTASVRHHELSDLARDETALRDRLQASISGADRGTGRAKKLERALFTLTTKGDKNPGRLKVAEAAVASAATSLEQGELALAQLERDRDALSAARERRRDADAALVERRSLLEKARQAERLLADRTAATERFERFRQAVEVATAIDHMAETHPSPNPLPVIRQSVERLRTLAAKIRDLTAALEGDERQVAFDIAPEPTWQPLSRWALLLVAVGVVVALASFVIRTVGMADLGVVPQVIGGIIAAIGLVLAAVAFWLRRNYTMQAELRDVQIDRRLRGRSEMQAELNQAEADTEQQLGSLGLTSLDEAEDLLTREEAHVAQMDRLAAQLDGLVGKEPPETLPALRDAAALEIDQKTGALDALGPIAKEPRARERLEVEVRDQEGALERARDDEANARARVEANAVDAEKVAAEAERLAMWREQLGALQRRHRVLDTTLRAIERAEQATMKTATRYLEGHMVRDVAAVTGGRYRRVRVDDKTLDIEVHTPTLERGEWVPVTTLSQGTLDLIYLTARLGLVRLVTGDRRPPLVFDDPFVTLDDDRAARALSLLQRVATDFQIIYLTTSDRYDGAADRVVELPGPTTVDDGVDDPSTVAVVIEGAA